MRVIFLDIDGVLNSIKWNQEHKEQIQNGILVDEAKVPLLKELADQTGAILVLHSGWRIWLMSHLFLCARNPRFYVRCLVVME